MFITTIAHYLPQKRVPNSFFMDINGLSDEWIFTRTGIQTRSRASANETTETMAREAVFKAIETLPYDIAETDLIIAASYTPVDTVATLAHYIQKEFEIHDTRATYLSNACSSFVNAVEVIEGYFATGKASKALLVISEHNTAYSSDSDKASGHLWGDGAAAMFISKTPLSPNDPQILDVQTKGLAIIGKGPAGVTLRPKDDGLRLPYGKDVYIHACQHMVRELESILKKNKLSIDDLAYVIPHQANVRIINNVANAIGIAENKMIVNMDKYGNTGSAGAIIALSESRYLMKKNDLIGITVFGGGYSSGAMLIKV